MFLFIPNGDTFQRQKRLLVTVKISGPTYPIKKALHKLSTFNLIEKRLFAKYLSGDLLKIL